LYYYCSLIYITTQDFKISPKCSDQNNEQPREEQVPELLTLQEACDSLNVHPNTLREWDRNSSLPATRIGAKRFWRDIMTEGELKEFAKRLKTAEMLINKTHYSVIEKETGFSSTTVARVSKWLNNGEGGYKKILNKIHHHNSIQVRRRLS